MSYLVHLFKGQNGGKNEKENTKSIRRGPSKEDWFFCRTTLEQRFARHWKGFWQVDPPPKAQRQGSGMRTDIKSLFTSVGLDLREDLRSLHRILATGRTDLSSEVIEEIEFITLHLKEAQKLISKAQEGLTEDQKNISL